LRTFIYFNINIKIVMAFEAALNEFLGHTDAMTEEKYHKEFMVR